MSTTGSKLQYPSLNRPWLRNTGKDGFKADAIAGLTNATIVLPQGVAFAITAGLPLEYGLFTAIIVTVADAFEAPLGSWSPSRQLQSLPYFVSLSSLALPGSEAYIALALVLTFVVGVLQLAAGSAGLRGLISFISHSVIVGFTAAAAVLIGVSQFGPALGLDAVIIALVALASVTAGKFCQPDGRRPTTTRPTKARPARALRRGSLVALV